MNREKWLIYFAVALLVVSVLQSSFIVYTNFESPHMVSMDAQATQGSFNLCLNHRPEIFFTCNTTMRQGFDYECQLSASDYDGDNLTFSSLNYSGSLQVDISPSGLIDIIPSQEMVGDSIILFTVEDSSGCQNPSENLAISFSVDNLNDAPVFIPPMGPFEIDMGSSIRGIYLNDYFYDLDGDPMTYDFSIVPPGFLVSLSESNELSISAVECLEGYMLFGATDIFNASGYSDPVRLIASCFIPEKSSPSGSSRSFVDDCESDWVCHAWQRCRVNGTQKKDCVDANGCFEDFEKTFWRDCVYVPECENGIFDFGEEGIDCGGLCSACPSCFDNIQNQEETGIDCGGPCSACRTVETPSPLEPEKNSPLILLALAVITALAGLIIVYRLFHQQIHFVFTKLWWLFARNFAKQILITEKQKAFFLNSLALLEKKDLLSSLDKKQFILFQEELNSIIRDFFVVLIGKKASLPEDAHLAFARLKTTSNVKRLLHGHFNQLLWSEQKSILPLTDLQVQLELFRERIFSISQTSRKELARDVNEFHLVKDPAHMRFKQLIYNSLLALQFEHVGFAKDKYLQALALYESRLSPAEQTRMYDLLRLLFNEISYVSSYSSKKR